ncbi:hypothetical protein [Limnobaculum parvum]|uniref:Uncharacterized protein n=1 Tax=Limnobaculum parvum TaxID=2172103 RepID=A0A2Y9U299_9GAMM|nr:hypothetical protein [Limnobaculum parvum]AWH89694.1 hypothetical protein HYN51_14765 [Limnobaculum parvum]
MVNRARKKLIKYMILAVVISSLLLAVNWYLLWSASISNRTVLIPEFPFFTITLIVSAIFGIIFLLCKQFKRTIKERLVIFLFGTCISLVVCSNLFDVYVYLFPEKTISYITEYKVSYLGPRRGKFGRCEAGLRIKEQYTGRWIEFCSSKEALKPGEQRKQGMNGVFVVAKVNKLGAYIVQYEFTDG